MLLHAAAAMSGRRCHRGPGKALGPALGQGMLLTCYNTSEQAACGVMIVA
jgi:hypothetical protein